MLFLIFAIISSTTIGNLLTIFNKNKNTHILLIFLGNYFIASIFSIVTNSEPMSNVGFLEVGLGSFTGFLFLAGFITYQRSIVSNGLSLSVGAMRFSLIVPTLLSVILFGERLGMFKIAGILIVLFSFGLFTDMKNPRKLILLLVLFAIIGVSDLNLKLYENYGLDSSGLFLVFLFGAAFVFNLILVLVKKIKFSWLSILFGFILGVPNQLTTKFFLLGLQKIDGSIAYPIFAGGVMLASILSDVVIWRKRFNKKQILALCLMVSGLVLLNIT